MLKIFIVEDERLIRTALRRIIESIEDEFEVVGESDNALDALAQLPFLMPNVLIVDIRMPEMDGLELARRVRSEYPEMGVIFLTGYSEFYMAQEAVKLGALDYILKPTKKEDIWNALMRAKERLHQGAQPGEKALFTQGEGQLIVNRQLAARYALALPDRLPCRKAVLLAIGYINRNYAHDLTLKHMGEVLFVNQTYFSEVFKKETGISFTDYLTIVRIEQAKRLLRQSLELKTYHVAEMVGYHDPKYFGQLFKRLTGKTPIEYRNQRSEGMVNQ